MKKIYLILIPLALAAAFGMAQAQTSVSIPAITTTIQPLYSGPGTATIDLRSYPEVIIPASTRLSYYSYSLYEDGGNLAAAGFGSPPFFNMNFAGTLLNSRCGDDGGTPYWCFISINGVSYQNKILTINYQWRHTKGGGVDDRFASGMKLQFTFPGGNYQQVVQPPTLTFTADNTNIQYGGATTLRWSSANTVSPCVASGDWSGTKPIAGAENTGTLTSNKNYILTCLAQDGTSAPAIKTVNINVAPPVPPSVSLSASRTDIRLGESSTLSWDVTGTNVSCSASGAWSGGKSTTGSQSVTPPSVGNHTYTLGCSGPGGNDSKSRTITVSDPLPSADIKASGSDGPISIGYYQSETISWTSVYAPQLGSQFPQYSGSCSVSKDGTLFAPGTSGNQSTGPLQSSQTYSISCTGALGSASDSVRVNVAAPTLSVALSANPLPPPGTASSYTTTLTANTSGTAIGKINYSLWWSCPNPTDHVNVAENDNRCGPLPSSASTPSGTCSENSNGVKCEAVNSPSLSRPHTFTCSAGGGTCNFRPKVITERDSLSATNAIGTPLLTILEPPRYFTLSKSGNLEAGVSVNPLAESNKIQITVNPLNLFDANVGLSVEPAGMPAGGTAYFGTSGASTANLSAPYPKTVDFWVTIPRTTATGGYTIRIRGTGGGVSDTVNIPLNVIERLPEFREI